MAHLIVFIAITKSTNGGYKGYANHISFYFACHTGDTALKIVKLGVELGLFCQKYGRIKAVRSGLRLINREVDDEVVCLKGG